MSHLAVVLAPVSVAAGRYQLSDKTVSGMRALAQRWSGRVSFVTAAHPAGEDTNLGLGWHTAKELGLEILSDEPVRALADLRPDVVQASVVLRDEGVLDLGLPTVLVAENTARERLRYAWPTLSPAARPRAAMGAARQELRQRAMVRRASALACNGWSAWSAYGRIAARAHDVAPVLFFDTRLSIDRVAAAHHRTGGPPGLPLRLAFSGRLHPAKGPQHAVQASIELDRRGVRHSMLVLGDGPLRAELEAVRASSVTFAGSLEFEPDWVETVARDVDVMVLPHTQGDPSGTYLESAGLGVPVAGFGNAALKGHEREGFAWASRSMTAAGLADLLVDLDRDRSRVLEASRRGVAFMDHHAMEPAFDARVDQLAKVAESTKGRRTAPPV